MKTFGNVLWFITVGLISGIFHILAGVLCCITIIGIPFGIAYFRLAKLSFLPFGKTVETDFDSHPVGNVIWLVLGGAEMAVGHAIIGAILCITIIGIPFGRQCFKLMKLSALPFGSSVN